MSGISSNNKRIAKNSVYMTIRMVIVLCINLYTTRVVLSVLGVADYGIYNVVCGFVSMFAFLNTSMSNGIQRFYNFELSQNGIEGGRRVYNTALLVQIVIAIVIIAVTETIGIWYLNNKMVIPEGRERAAHWIFQLSIISFLIITMKAPYVSSVMAHEKMNFYAIMSVLNSVGSLVIVFLLRIASADRLILYGVLLATVSVVDFIAYYLYCKSKFEEIVVERKIHRGTLKSMLSFSGWNIFGTMGGMVKEQGVNMIMNLFQGTVVNAARGVAMQVSSGLQSFVSNLSVPVRPQLTQSYARGEIDRVMKLTFSISKLSCCCLFVIALPILLEIDFVLQVWLGPNVPKHTGAFVWIVVISSFAANLNSAVSGVVHSSGRMKTYQLSGCAVNLVTLPLAYWVLSIGLEPEYALAISCIMTFLGQFIALLVMKTIIDYSLRDYLKEVILPFVVVVLLSTPLPVWTKTMLAPGLLRFFVIGVESVVISLMVIYLAALNAAEKNMVVELLNKVIKK